MRSVYLKYQLKSCVYLKGCVKIFIYCRVHKVYSNDRVKFLPHRLSFISVYRLKLKPQQRLFDQKDINTQVVAFNGTILNIFRNYVPNKYITVDDKDPVWMNKTIKSNIKAKNVLYQKYIQNGRFESDFVCLENLIIELNELISSTKTLYYENLAKKLNNALLQAKTYWSILKIFYNDKNISLIPPLLVDNKLVTDIRQKQTFSMSILLSNVHLKNSSVLPINQTFLTQSRLTYLDFNEEEIL